jgi:hypothetical protein
MRQLIISPGSHPSLVLDIRSDPIRSSRRPSVCIVYYLVLVVAAAAVAALVQLFTFAVADPTAGDHLRSC